MPRRGQSAEGDRGSNPVSGFRRKPRDRLEPTTGRLRKSTGSSGGSCEDANHLVPSRGAVMLWGGSQRLGRCVRIERQVPSRPRSRVIQCCRRGGPTPWNGLPGRRLDACTCSTWSGAATSRSTGAASCRFEAEAIAPVRRTPLSSWTKSRSERAGSRFAWKARAQCFLWTRRLLWCGGVARRRGLGTGRPFGRWLAGPRRVDDVLRPAFAEARQERYGRKEIARLGGVGRAGPSTTKKSPEMNTYQYAAARIGIPG